MLDETSDAALAAVHATTPDALAEHKLAVIGIMNAHDGPAALLRSSRGQVARVRAGDTAFGTEITAIGEAQVVLTDRWGRTQSLAFLAS